MFEFEEYKGYLISQDAFGYYEVWTKSGHCIKEKIHTKEQAIEIINNL